MKEKRNESHENGTRLLRYQMQSVAKHILPKNRVGICLRQQVQSGGTVDVFKHRQTQKAFYGGLMICGSVWVCPVCAAKISERRRVELRRAFDMHRAAGGQCTMMTLTFSHSVKDKLDDILIALSKAMIKFREKRAYKNLVKSMGLIGTIRALEVTYGANGWHPHIHMLILHDYGFEPWERQFLQDEFFEIWEKSCAAVGLTTSAAHGLRLDDAAEADSYIGKWGDLITKDGWGVDHEMTKANSKKGRAGSLTPFDFLRLVVEDGDLEYTLQYREYAEAMKGKRQLVWSQDLKKRFLIEDKTDEEVAEAKEELADLLGGLTWQDWQYIIKHDYRAKLLDYIESQGYDAAIEKIGLKKRDCPENREQPTEIKLD